MQVKSEALQGASFKTPLVASLAEGTAELSRIALAVAGVNARLDAKVTGLTGDPVAAGQLQVEPFVPRDTLALFGVDIETAEPSALTKADLSTRYRAGAQVAALDALELRLDETRLTGSASVRRFAAPLIRFDLAVDGVDVDRYLPPSSEGAPPATPAAVAGAGAAQLPLAMLRGMDVQGQLRVGTLKAANLRSSDVQASLQGKEGLYRLHPAGAKLYQGSYTGDMTFDVRQELPRIAMDEKLTGVQAGPLLQDLMGRPYVSGTANVSAAVNARGLTPEQVKQTLNGQAAFAFRDGAVDGINVGLLIRKALAAAQGQKAPADEVKQTDFAALGGTLTIKDGLVRNEDLSAKSPLLRVEGEGSVNLVTEAVDYLIRTAVVGTAEGQGGKELEQLKGLTVPLRIKGTFSDPKFSVELDKALEQRAQEALKKEQKKLEERLKKGLEDKLKGLLR
jgi:AsmA protein